MMRLRWVVAILWASGLAMPARGDQFEAIEGKALAEALKGPDAKAVGRLTIADLGAMSSVLKDARGALLAVKTGRGNVARLLVTPELRRAEEGGGAPIPVFVLERFDTFDAADLVAKVASGRAMMLFPGFQVDLDTGQVVPEGQGGDLAVSKEGEPAIVALKGTTLFAIANPPAPDPSKPPRPTPGRAVVPGDFAGRYRLFANGQWSGTLDLTVDGRDVSGRFRSDTHGSSYSVTGRVAADEPNKVDLTVKFPRAQADFAGHLWTDGKGAIAGTFRLQEKSYGFFAVREGGRVAPAGVEEGPIGK
jgi:hypothetical protein